MRQLCIIILAGNLYWRIDKLVFSFRLLHIHNSVAIIQLRNGRLEASHKKFIFLIKRKQEENRTVGFYKMYPIYQYQIFDSMDNILIMLVSAFLLNKNKSSISILRHLLLCEILIDSVSKLNFALFNDTS